MIEVPKLKALTKPVLEIVEEPVLLDTHALLEAAVPDPVS
jgi:hypothetical protein